MLFKSPEGGGIKENVTPVEAVASVWWYPARLPGDRLMAAAFDPLSSYGISSALGGGYYAASTVLDFFGGSADALPLYQKLLDGAYAQYLLMRHAYYSLEQRWAGEAFWRRRHAQLGRSSYATPD